MASEKKCCEIKWSARAFLTALAACIVLVGICYWWVDKPLVLFLHHHGSRKFNWLTWLIKLPKPIHWLMWAALSYSLYRFYRKSFSYFDRFVFHFAASLLAVNLFKYPLKFIFARYFPSTFHENNLSLIKDGVYGFSFFNSGVTYEAFPSGYTAAVFAVATLIWYYYPRWRWPAVLLPALVCIGEIGLYYHFVGDVIGGAFLGILTTILILQSKTFNLTALS